MTTKQKIWIPDSQIPRSFQSVSTYQKIIWRLYKTYDLDRDFINTLLKIHYQEYQLFITDKVDYEHYLDVCWKIAEKLAKYKTTETKKDIENLFGFITNRWKEGI